ncbi:hypothetical protein Q671_10145 [Halomonas sp. PBN3]|nr:hypothetical protein Q671_10145 [Halomonas sp. PBN3]
MKRDHLGIGAAITAGGGVGGHPEKTSGHRMAAAWRPPEIDGPRARRLQYGSIEPFETLALTLELLGVTLDGSGRLALALRGRLLVVLATTHLGENTGFFAGTLEATQCDVKRLVITYFDRRH